MPIYDIAGLRVEIADCKGRTLKQAEKYLSPDQSAENKPDIKINITKDKVIQAMSEHPELNSDDWEYMLTGSAFYTKLTAFDGILLHSSCIVVDGVAYAFSADSGVGKSTHTKLWLERFGERPYMLNDDKPAIRIIDGTVYACGTPWSGKYDYSTPAVVPLGAICFIKRGEHNSIKKADVKTAIFNIFSQTVRRLSEVSVNRVFDTLDEMFKKVPVYELECDISREAVEVSYNALKRSINEFE